MKKPVSSTIEVDMQTHDGMHYTLKKFGNDLVITFVRFLDVENWKFFSFTL